MLNLLPFLDNTGINQISLNTGAGDIKHYPTPYPVPNPAPVPTGGPFYPTGSGILGTDNTLMTILCAGAILTLFSLLFFPQKNNTA